MSNIINLQEDKIQIIKKLESDFENNNLWGLAVLAIHPHGRVSIQYSDYMAEHSAQTVGYLDVLRQELTEITRGNSY